MEFAFLELKKAPRFPLTATDKSWQTKEEIKMPNEKSVTIGKYADKKPYNSIAPAANEELAPILVTKELMKDKSIIKDNMETWNIHGHRIPVAFALSKQALSTAG